MKNMTNEINLVKQLEILNETLNTLMNRMGEFEVTVEDRLSAIEGQMVPMSVSMPQLNWDEVDARRDTAEWRREQGRFLRSIRKQRSMTLESLEEKLGVSKSTLSKAELGDTAINKEILAKLLGLLEYPIEEFHLQVIKGLDPAYRSQFSSGENQGVAGRSL